jgi:hypothetical protein
MAAPEGGTVPHTADRCYELDGGRLKVSLSMDHAITAHEYEALDEVAASYFECFEKVSPAAPAGDENDEAIYELGGEENICAG